LIENRTQTGDLLLCGRSVRVCREHEFLGCNFPQGL
jgi:hypothetical protein